MTNRENDRHHAASLYEDVIEGKPVEQDGKMVVVPITDSLE